MLLSFLSCAVLDGSTTEVRAAPWFWKMSAKSRIMLQHHLYPKKPHRCAGGIMVTPTENTSYQHPAAMTFKTTDHFFWMTWCCLDWFLFHIPRPVTVHLELPCSKLSWILMHGNNHNRISSQKETSLPLHNVALSVCTAYIYQAFYSQHHTSVQLLSPHGSWYIFSWTFSYGLLALWLLELGSCMTVEVRGWWESFTIPTDKLWSRANHLDPTGNGPSVRPQQADGLL